MQLKRNYAKIVFKCALLKTKFQQKRLDTFALTVLYHKFVLIPFDIDKYKVCSVIVHPPPTQSNTLTNRGDKCKSHHQVTHHVFLNYRVATEGKKCPLSTVPHPLPLSIFEFFEFLPSILTLFSERRRGRSYRIDLQETCGQENEARKTNIHFLGYQMLE